MVLSNNKNALIIQTNKAKQLETIIERLFMISVCLFADLLLSLVYSSWSILFCGLLGTALLMLLSRGMNKRALHWLIVAKIVSTVFVLIIYYGCLSKYGAPYYIGGSDDAHSEADGVTFASEGMIFPWDWHNNINDKGFIFLLGWIMRIVGVNNYHTISFRVLNCYFWICVGAIIYKICNKRLNFSCEESLKTMIVLTLFPNALYLSSFVFRDTLNSLLFVLTFALIDDFLRKKEQTPILIKNRFLAIVLTGFITFCGYWIRSEILYFVVLFMLLSLLRNKSLSLKNLLILGVSSIFAIFLFNYFGFLDLILEKINIYTGLREQWALEDSTNGVFKLIFTIPLFPFGIFLRIAYGLVYPLPTALLDFLKIFTDGLALIDFVSAIGVCFQIAVLPFLFLNFKRIDKYFLSYFAILLSFVISTFTFRHVLLFYPFLAIILFRQFFSKQYSKNNKRVMVFIGAVALVLLALLYGIVKIF